MAAGARVLVVDDEPDIRATIRDILEDEGYAVDLAESAATAREARRRQRPDVVLLDIWMPDLDGISLLREWSERGGLPCPVIMHLIPADAAVARAIARVRVGAIVTLRGHLVEARRTDGWRWRSSLTREDSGAGACELVLVDALETR